VGHVHERDPDLDLDALELDLELPSELEVQGAQRLIEQEHGRAVDQGTRQRHPLLLPAGQLVERIFRIPGTGSHFVNAALNRDYTLAMGVTILFTVLVYGANTLVDLAYTFLDPRIKLEES
jgi:hypothetical protein